jgi:hypothetical protein
MNHLQNHVGDEGQIETFALYFFVVRLCSFVVEKIASCARIVYSWKFGNGWSDEIKMGDYTCNKHFLSSAKQYVSSQLVVF